MSGSVRTTVVPIDAIDDVSRAKAIVLTVWMALHAPEFTENAGEDAGAISDTLYEAYERLGSATRAMSGVDHG